jgi:hypothetical protein
VAWDKYPDENPTFVYSSSLFESRVLSTEEPDPEKSPRIAPEIAFALASGSSGKAPRSHDHPKPSEKIRFYT